MSTWWEARTVRVNQATGIVSEQAGCTPSEARTLLRRRAAETESDLEDVAMALIGRRISFSEKNWSRRV